MFNLGTKVTQRTARNGYKVGGLSSRDSIGSDPYAGWISVHLTGVSIVPQHSEAV